VGPPWAAMMKYQFYLGVSESLTVGNGRLTREFEGPVAYKRLIHASVPAGVKLSVIRLFANYGILATNSCFRENVP
jgi:hypothetical protein